MSQVMQFSLPQESVVGVVSYAGLKDRLARVINGRLQEYLLKSLKLPPKPEFLAACADAFDKYVVNYDIPQLPNFIEESFDDALEAMFLRLVSNLYDRVAAQLA